MREDGASAGCVIEIVGRLAGSITQLSYPRVIYSALPVQKIGLTTLSDLSRLYLIP